MKFGQLMKYNMRNIFLEKSYTKCGEAASLRPFYKKSKFNMYLDQQSEMVYNFVFWYVRVEVLTTLSETYLKHKRGLDLVSLQHFLHKFWRNISHIIFY